MNLLIRADASTQIGTGHVMRCMALAQAWKQKSRQAVFVLGIESPAIEARLQFEGIKIIHLTAQPGSAEDAYQTANLAQQLKANWVVVDGYHFNSNYQRILKKAGCRQLFIDDEGKLEHYYADCILSQNICADESWYLNREPDTKLLIGVQYTLLRKEFWKWQAYLRKTPQFAHKILVTLGGSDPDNVTLKVIQALYQVEETEGLEAIIVIGGSNPHYKQLQLAIQGFPYPVWIERNVANMPDLMNWADIAITGGGSTSLEMAFMGLPNLVLILANNQQLSVEKLDNMGVCMNLGWYDKVDVTRIKRFLTKLRLTSSWRLSMSQAGKNLIDGRGCERTLSSIMDYN